MHLRDLVLRAEKARGALVDFLDFKLQKRAVRAVAGSASRALEDERKRQHFEGYAKFAARMIAGSGVAEKSAAF